MIKILEVYTNDLSKNARNVEFSKIRIEELNATAFQEALISDIVIFQAGGNRYILKDR